MKEATEIGMLNPWVLKEARDERRFHGKMCPYSLLRSLIKGTGYTW